MNALRPLRRAAVSFVAAVPLLLPAAPARAGDTPPPVEERLLPFGAAWARERGIELPAPFGVGLFLVTMGRDIEVTDVRVTLPGNEPVSVSDVGDFGVRNATTLAAVKLDAWILPVLDVYVMAGHTWTDSRLDATVTVDRVLGEDVVLTLSQDAKVGGPLVGAGATAVAGAGPWFIMADANYNWSDIEGIEGGIGAVFASARTGWSGRTGWGSWRAWLGAAYLVTSRTLRIEQESPGLGTVVVEVDQRPVSPTTLQGGGGVTVGTSWDVLLEAGSNFGDAFVGVFSAAYRF